MRFEQIMSNEVLDIRDGTHESPKYKDTGYPLITSKNLKHGRIDFSDVNFISEEDYISINKRSKVNKGDVLYSMIGSIGNYAFVDNEPNYAIKNVALFRFIDKRLYNKFFLHLINSSIFQRQIEQRMKGGTQKFVSLKILRNLKIPLPPIEEQKKIAAILDAAADYRQKTKALIDKYDQLTQSLFLDMFGDPVTNPKGWILSPLGEVIDVRDGTHDSPKYIHEGYPLITSKNIVGGKLKFNEVNLISKLDFDNINKRSKVDYGDIIMPMIGTIGNPVEILTKEPFAIKNVALFKKSTDSLLLIPVLLMLLKGHFLLHYSRMNNRGGTQKFLSLGAIRKMPVFLPPLSLQNQFAERIAQIEKQKQQAEASLVKAEELFNSLLQKAFKG